MTIPIVATGSRTNDFFSPGHVRLAQLPLPTGGGRDEFRVEEEWNQYRRRRTLGHTLLLLLRDDPGSARHSSAVFHGRVEEQRVLSVDNLDLRTTNRGTSQRGLATSSA